MQTMLAVVLFGMLLIGPRVSAAEDGECQARCADERISKEATCPPEGENDDARAQCLLEAQEAYAGCIAACTPPNGDEPPATDSREAPAESQPAPADAPQEH